MRVMISNIVDPNLPWGQFSMLMLTAGILHSINVLKQIAKEQRNVGQQENVSFIDNQLNALNEWVENAITDIPKWAWWHGACDPWPTRHLLIAASSNCCLNRIYSTSPPFFYVRISTVPPHPYLHPSSPSLVCLSTGYILWFVQEWGVLCWWCCSSLGTGW